MKNILRFQLVWLFGTMALLAPAAPLILCLLYYPGDEVFGIFSAKVSLPKLLVAEILGVAAWLFLSWSAGKMFLSKTAS